jgi:hypothetical protein
VTSSLSAPQGPEAAEPTKGMPEGPAAAQSLVISQNGNSGNAVIVIYNSTKSPFPASYTALAIGQNSKRSELEARGTR